MDCMKIYYLASGTAVVAEWLRRWTRNPLGSARTGSNPVGSVHFDNFFQVSQGTVALYTGIPTTHL